MVYNDEVIFMKYLILSLVANLLVFGVLSAIGLNINILAAMMMILVIQLRYQEYYSLKLI